MCCVQWLPRGRPSCTCTCTFNYNVHVLHWSSGDVTKAGLHGDKNGVLSGSGESGEAVKEGGGEEEGVGPVGGGTVSGEEGEGEGGEGGGVFEVKFQPTGGTPHTHPPLATGGQGERGVEGEGAVEQDGAMFSVDFRATYVFYTCTVLYNVHMHVHMYICTCTHVHVCAVFNYIACTCTESSLLPPKRAAFRCSRLPLIAWSL